YFLGILPVVPVVSIVYPAVYPQQFLNLKITWKYLCHSHFLKKCPLYPRKWTSAATEDQAAYVAKRDAKSLSNFAATPVGEASNCSLLPKTAMAATNAPRESINGVATAEIPGSRWPEWDARCAD